MNVTPTDVDRTAPARSDRLAALRQALSASGWSAQVVQLPAGERAERISDYALEA